VLVEEYEELRCLKSTERYALLLLCQLIDVERAISRLGPKEYQAVLLCGLLGVSDQAAGQALGVHQTTMTRRYMRALALLAADLNGDSVDEG